MKTLLSLFLLLTLGSVSCSAKPAETARKDPDSRLTIREILEKYYSDKYFFIGASARTDYLEESGAQYERWVKEFVYNTPENDFKQSKVYAQPAARWRNEDYLHHIEIARRHGQVIRAHGPVSPQCSKWVREDTRTPEELEEVLRTFMEGLSREVQANSDVVKWMDVVNETFCGARMKGIGYDAGASDNTVTYEADDWFGPRAGVEIWENPWPILGFETAVTDDGTFEVPKYIRMAFEIAQRNAPDVKLIYNEHGKTMLPALWEKLRKTVLYLRSQQIRVDGIGWQAHIQLGWEKDPENLRMLREMIAWCHENGLEFHITELDVTVANKDSEMNTSCLEATRDAQAATIGVIVETMLQNIGRGACGVNFWTMTDRFREGTTFATLFDNEANPQPAYYKVKELLLKYTDQSSNNR